MKGYKSLEDAMTDLDRRGYTASFEEEHFCLYCRDLSLRLSPEEFEVDEVYRFEKEEESEENCVLYAISSSAGLKGVMVDSVE